VGTEKRKEGRLYSHPAAHSNKNDKKCDEMVTAAFLRVEKAAAAGSRQAGEVCSHGGTKARRKEFG